MNKLQKKYRVIIIGGGPVGLFLGCCLQHHNISCLILEKKKNPMPHSRSIGIHPVSLELFAHLNVADCFVKQGIKIKRGVAYSDSKLLGSISFENCLKPYNFVLSFPQYNTERLLQNSLSRSAPDTLLREASVLDFNATDTSVTVRFEHNRQIHSAEADYLIGCDGKNSLVRKKAGISFKGTSYPDSYIMGDFSDNTDFGTDAVIFLTAGGLVESFPLINNKRRWVVKTEKYITEVKRSDIEQRLLQRIGHDISGELHSMLSSFGVQKLIAKTFVRGRIILAGDAAHVVSPIGGQGMNLGWMDAWELARTFRDMYESQDSDHRILLRDYSRRQQKVARKVIRRAELNTRLGRKTAVPFLRNAVVWLMLNTPLNKLMAQIFTMRRLR